MVVDKSDSGSTPSRWSGRLLVIAAAILWSTGGFFAKAPIFDDWPEEYRGALLAFWRATFASLVLIFLVRKVTWSWRLVPGAAVFAAMNWAFLSALVHGEATLAIWLQYTAPVWVFLGSWLWFREQPTRRDWVLFGFATIGVAIIILSQMGQGATRGLQLGLLSGLFFGGVVLSLRWMRDIDSAWIIFLYHLVTAILFAPVLIQSEIYPSGVQWFYLLCFGPIQMGIPYVLFARGVRTIPGHEASGLSLLEPILVPVWVFVAWRTHVDYEAPAIATLGGAGLILIGLIIRYSKIEKR